MGVACTWRWKPRPRVAARTRCGRRGVEIVCGTWRPGWAAWGVRPAGRLPGPVVGVAGAGACRREGGRGEVMVVVLRDRLRVGPVLRRSRTGFAAGPVLRSPRRGRGWTGVSVA